MTRQPAGKCDGSIAGALLQLELECCYAPADLLTSTRLTDPCLQGALLYHMMHVCKT